MEHVLAQQATMNTRSTTLSLNALAVQIIAAVAEVISVSPVMKVQF
jgi:hypothetical protein